MRTSSALAAIVGALAALISTGNAVAAGTAPPPLWTHGMLHVQAQHIELIIEPATAGQLLQLDWRTGVTPLGPDERVQNANFAIRPGDPVTMTVVNYTTETHTFTAPKLGVSTLIHAGSATHPTRTVFTIVAPGFGTYRWFCALPCGGYMGGTVYAIVKA